jgi:DNA-binding winged helix-turn-helix (wHTH) protein
MRMRFDDFLLDYDARLLERADGPVHLSPKALELLQLLVASQPAALSKAQIQDRLWPKARVASVNLPVLVHQLREALGDDPHTPRYVRTVARFGYAFCGQARPDHSVAAAGKAPAASREFRLFYGDREISLDPGREYLLGRQRDADVWVDHRSVSRRHAVLRVGPDGVTVEDCGSRNGTFVGTEKVVDSAVLHDRDTLYLGSVPLLFRRFEEEETTAPDLSGPARA